MSGPTPIATMSLRGHCSNHGLKFGSTVVAGKNPNDPRVMARLDIEDKRFSDPRDRRWNRHMVPTTGLVRKGDKIMAGSHAIAGLKEPLLGIGPKFWAMSKGYRLSGKLTNQRPSRSCKLEVFVHQRK